MRRFLLLLTAALCQAADLSVPDDVLIERAIDYASIPHGKLAMDVVRPKAPGNYPGIIMIHGAHGWYVVGGGSNGVEFNFLLIFSFLTFLFPEGLVKKSKEIFRQA